ncbi:MAG: carbon-nitrogen hydrolase family protein [Gammaproteobacteria bacterium]|nr:MAG: carbon-nitrogen hydrolase family protein [Gammaproteobacteria bacterium]
MSTDKKYAAAVQMVSTDQLDHNLRQAESLIKIAADKGVQFILLPENFAFMGNNTPETISVAEEHGKGKIQETISRLAHDLRITIAAGSIPILDKTGKARASCLVYGKDGQEIARYDKKHLFDVYIKASQETYRESDTYNPGKNVVVIQTSIGKVGLSICYDIRFPEMYREMHEAGVEIIIVPSAFTEQTGRVHWEPLLRARAVENLCYVIAADQGGVHTNGRKTYGNSMIIDPWGRIKARLEKGAGVIFSEIDLDLQKKMREEFPVLLHR